LDGFFEKTILVILVSILVPYFIAQFKLPLAATLVWALISLVLASIVSFLGSRNVES
jgi:hypothetical protein